MKKFSLVLTSIFLFLSACTMPSSNQQTANEPPAGKRMPVTWNTSDAGTGEAGMPLTKITLMSGDAILYETTCNGSASQENLEIEGSVASIECWFAGGGDQYAAFVDAAEKITVKHRTVDEEGGYGAWENATSK